MILGLASGLVVGLTNLSARSITVPHNDKFLAIEFHRLEQAVPTTYNGPYWDRYNLSPEDIRAVMEREYMSQTGMMRTLEVLVSTVEGLKHSINWWLPLILGAIMGIGFVIASLI